MQRGRSALRRAVDLYLQGNDVDAYENTINLIIERGVDVLRDIDKESYKSSLPVLSRASAQSLERINPSHKRL